MGLFHKFGKWGRGLWHTVRKEGASILHPLSKAVGKFSHGLWGAAKKVAAATWQTVKQPLEFVRSAENFIQSPFGFATTAAIVLVGGFLLLKILPAVI